MITQAIQTTLSAIITSYSRIAPQTVELPFCVHDENAEPVRTKDGIVGYSYTVTIIVMASTTELLNTHTTNIRAAIEAMAGQTIDNTIIEAVHFENDDPEFDEPTGFYINRLSYTIETTNR